MAWTSPKTWVTGGIVLASELNTEVRDNLRYLRGADGTVQIQDGLELTGTGTASYLKPPVLTTTQRDAIVSPANGMIIFNTTLGKLEKYEATAWRSDMAYGGTLTYLSVPSMAQGDIFYADTGTSIARLGAGTSGDYLKTQGASANPVWTTPALNAALYIDNSIVNSTAASTLKVYTMPANTIAGTGALRITQMGGVGSAAGAILGIRIDSTRIAVVPQLADDVGTGYLSITIQGINSTSQRYQTLGYTFRAGTAQGTAKLQAFSGTLSLNVGSSWVIDSTAGGGAPISDHLFLVEKLIN